MKFKSDIIAADLNLFFCTYRAAGSSQFVARKWWVLHSKLLKWLATYVLSNAEKESISVLRTRPAESSDMQAPV